MNRGVMTENFDLFVDRTHSDAVKWSVYPKDILPMWVADMDFLSPPAVIKTLQNRVNHGVFGYTFNPPDLDETIVTWVNDHYHMPIESKEILYVPGVVTGFNMVARAFLKDGDGVIFQPPIYPPFFELKKNGGFENHCVDLVQNKEGRYEIDLAALEKGLRPNTRMFLLCNPHNPTGRVFSQMEMEQIADFCSYHDLLLCSDEIHCDLVYPPARHIPIMSLNEDIAQRTVMLFAPSKTFNIAGLGFSVMIIKNEKMMERMKKKFAGILPHPDLLAVLAARAAYQESSEWLADLLSYLKTNRDYLLDYIHTELPDIKLNAPEGTYLAWLDCRETDFAKDPYTFFLEKAKVALNDGNAFGEAGKGFVRLNFGCPRDVLRKGLERMRNAMLAVQ